MSVSPPCCKCFSFLRHEHDTAQKNTFTKWINYHLETHSSSSQVKDLFEDLKDGVVLCHLIEVLTGEALPVNKARVSKRVHHISNLTTALSSLRRRGLDLVNNNPADIADGNPRIVLGLIWQIILHFQIETNVQLLREWGFELEGSSPSTSRTASSGSSPISKLPQRLKIGRLKAPVERVVLRWVNAHLSDPYGISVHDMDRSWRDGIAFNALIHRAKPELVDMEQVRRSQPRDNLEQAFRLARDYLQIRPLLDVEDMLCEKPDKRSVITYVSQFIRSPSLVCPIAAGPVMDDRSLLLWVESTLLTLRDSSAAPVLDQYQTHLSLRKEYFDRRHAYLSLRENSTTLPRDEWNRIDSGWKKIGDLLTEQSHGFENELPASLSGLAQWLCTAEQIIRRPIELRVDDAQQTLSRINETVEQHRAYFADYPSRLERFQSVYLSRRVENREIGGEFLGPLKTRLDAVGHEAPRRLEHLHHLQSHYMILAYLESLNQKMELWKSGNSASLVQRWIKEYKAESEAAPEKKLRRLIAHLKEVTSEATDESYERILKQCEESSAEVIEKFVEMRHYLDSLLSYWREFESCLTKVEEKVNRSERQKRNLMDADANELIRRAEHARDGIARMASANGRETANTRLAELRRRIASLSRYSLGGRLVADVEVSGARAAISPVEKPSQTAAMPTSMVASALKPSTSLRLQAWIEEAQQKLAIMVTNLSQLDDLMQQISECQKDVQSVESERMALLKMRGTSEGSIAEYRKMRKAVQARAESIKIVRPLFSAFEKNHKIVQTWINEEKRDQSEYGQKTDALNNMKFLLESLSREEYSTWIDTKDMSSRLDVLLKNFKKCTTAEEESTKQHAAEEQIAALLADKEKLIKKREQSWSDYEQTQRDMLEIDRKLQEYMPFKEGLGELDTLWIRKQKAADTLRSIVAEGAKLEELAQNEKRTVALASLADQLDSLIGQCAALTETSLFKLRDDCLHKLTVFRSTVGRSLQGAELRVKELSLVGETDLQVAAKVLKDIEQEAQRLSESERERLEGAIKEASEVIRVKMDLFARLQRFYETIVAIKNENAAWNTISSSQARDVHGRLDELLSRIETEYAPEANTLCAQIETVQASFFQLECDRVKEKFRLLVMQLNKLADLMAKRKLFLLKFEEFQKFVKNAEGNLLGSIRDASEGKQVDMQRITNEMTCVFDKLNVLGDELAECQVGANMTITDATITDAVTRIRNLPLFTFEEKVGEFSDHFQRFLDLTSELQNSFTIGVAQFDDAESSLSLILQLQEDEREETRLMESLERLADELRDAEKERAAEIVVKVKQVVPQRQESRRIIIEDHIEKLIIQMTQELDEIESGFDKEIGEKNLQAVEKIEANKWKPFIVKLKKMKSLTTENERWRSISDQMGKREFEIDERISKFKEMMAKKIHRQEKLVKKLASFHEWLNLVDEDFASIQGWPPENETAIKEALLNIRKVCLKQQKFIKKLKSAKLPPPHSAEAEICCERFQVTLEKISSYGIEEGSNIPSSVTYLLPSTSMQSQSSLYSWSSSGTEEEAEEERLNEMEGVPEEIVGYASDLVQRISTAEGLMEIRQLFPEIDAELNDIAKSLSVLNADYARSLKPLSQAQGDLKALKGLQARRKLLETECEKFSSKLDGDELAILRSFIHQSRSLEGPIQDFMDELRKEIDDEIALRTNYENIMMELNRLNDDVSHRTKSAVTEMRQQVENVEAELALLRAQCSQRRNYVENSIEGSSPAASPGASRRKRIILMVSRTVTTIIQVVEDELRRSPGSKEKDLLEFRQKLEEMNASIEESHDEKGIEVLITSAKNLDEDLRNILNCDFSKQRKDELEASLATAHEGRVELERILRALQREHPPSTDVSACVENIIALITSLQALEIGISEQIQARAQGDVVIEEAGASETSEQEENAVKMVAELRGLLEEEESILGDKHLAADIIEETIEKVERVLSESRRLQSVMPTHTLYEDLRVLIAELESINGKLIERHNAYLTFKNECRFVSDLVDKVLADVTDTDRKRQSTDELIETIERLQKDEEELAKMDGSSMIRIQELCEMLKPMEVACAETRLLQADVDRAKQLLSEAIKDKIREKETVEHVQKEIAELDDMLQKGEEVLLTEEELKRSDDSTLLAANVKITEEIEQSLLATLEQINASDLERLSEEQQADVEKKRERTHWMLDRIRALREALTLLLDSLRAWNADKDVLKSATVALADQARELVDSYANNAQPYTTACNDIKKANDLLNRINEDQQKLSDVNQRLKTTLPECKAALDDANKMVADLASASSDVRELLTPLTDDVNKQKELLDEQDTISAKLNELSDRAVELLASAEDSKRAEIDEIRHQLDGVKQQLNDLQRKQEMPIRLVFHPEALKVDSLLNQLENVERVLSEKQEHLAAQLVLVALTSTIARETAQLRDAIESAQKVEDDAHADINELQKAIDVLKNARAHLEALKDAYDQIEQSPDTDTLRTQTLDEQTTLSENYEAVERALEDRLENLKHFNEDAAKFEMGLSQLDDIIREQGTPSAEMELSSIDSIIQRCNDLRPTLDQLAESVQSLSPLIEPASRVDALNIRQRETKHKLKALRDDVIRLKEEHDAENALAAAIDDLERTLTDAECGFEQTEASLTALQLFCDVPLRTVADKITLVDEIQSDIVTPKIEQLRQEKRALEGRYTSLAERANEKFEEAKQQNELITDIDTKLNNIQKDADALCNKYTIPQELSTAIEDVNRIEALLEQLPESSQISHVTDRQLQEQLSKHLDAIQLSLKGLLVPLEKDVLKEQELLRDIRSALSELTSTGDDVVAIDPEIEPNEQLDNVAHLGDNLRQLKGKVEKLERRLQSPEGLIKRTPLSDDLSVRIAQLQDALENKKQQLTDRAKLQTLAPEISLITESVQGRLEEIELSSLQSVDEQSAILQDLESKKQQLESLIGNIPAGSEGDELRERSFWHLGQLNDLLGRLAAAVGDKLAALAAFNATKDEVQAQLSLIDAPVKVRLEPDSVQAINDRIGELNDKLSNAEKLSNKLGSIDEAELDAEKLAEKQTLLLAIEAAKHRIKDERDSAQQQLDRAIALEKTRAECEQLTADLAALVAEATKLLSDSDAVPTMFATTADAFVLPLEHAKQVLNNAPAEDAQFIHLNALVSEAKDAHSALLHRADIWRQFVAERDSATDQLEVMRAPLDEIELRRRRSFDEVLQDLEALKELHLKWSVIKNLSPRLLSLSSELHPLFTALQDARLFASNVEIVERRFENLIDSMSAEFRVREELVRSLDMISHELRSIHAAFDGQRLSVHRLLEIRQQLQGLRAHLTLLDEDITKFNANRLYLIEEEEISTGRNFDRLQQIEDALKSVEAVEDQVGYDIEAAAEVLAAVFPDRDPRSIMREKGIPFDDLSSSDGCKSDLEVEVEEGAAADVPLSPIPDDPAPARSHYERQRSRWRRILRTALPLQAMLVLLLGAACLVPHCDDEYCCQLLNNFARSFDPSLDFVNGPPPF